MSNKRITGLRYSRDNWFTCVDTIVMLDCDLSHTAKIIFAVLCVLAGFGHRSCSPSSDDYVSIIAHVPVSAVLKAYQELEDRGVIARDGNVIYLIGHNASCYSEEDAL